MFHYLKRNFVFFLLCLSMTACNRYCCQGLSKAPTLQLEYATCSSQTNNLLIIRYQKVYAMDGKKKPQLVPQGTDLPISMVSDTTFYIFEGMNIFDTVAITYKRNFYFESPKCGFVVDMSNIQVIKEMSSLKQSYVTSPYDRNDRGRMVICR